MTPYVIKIQRGALLCFGAFLMNNTINSDVAEGLAGLEAGTVAGRAVMVSHDDSSSLGSSNSNASHLSHSIECL